MERRKLRLLEDKLPGANQTEAASEEEPDLEVEQFAFSEEYTEGDVEVKSSTDSSYISHSGTTGISSTKQVWV